VEHFAVPAPKEPEDIHALVGDGRGTKLRDIPNVAFKMGKLTGKDELMEGLHNVIFRRKGVVGVPLGVFGGCQRL
jgi:protein DEK